MVWKPRPLLCFGQERLQLEAWGGLGVGLCCMRLPHSVDVTSAGSSSSQQQYSSSCHRDLGRNVGGCRLLCTSESVPWLTMCSVGFDVILNSVLFVCLTSQWGFSLFIARALTRWKFIKWDGWFSSGKDDILPLNKLLRTTLGNLVLTSVALQLICESPVSQFLNLYTSAFFWD